MFIKLTSLKGNIIFRVNPNLITFYYGQDGDTDITFVGENGNGILVKESPEQIDELIRKAQPKNCTCDDYPDFSVTGPR